MSLTPGVLRLSFALFCLPIGLCLAACQASQSNGKPESTPRKVILTILAGQSNTDAGIEEMINETVAAQLPAVKLEWERVDWGDQFQSQMQLKFAAGEVPDIMIGKAQDVATYVPSGNLAPMPEGLRSYVDSAVSRSVSSGGLPYGIPYNLFYQGVLYNKALFERLGLTVPRTLAEMRVVADSLSARGVTPFASHFEESWYAGNIAMQLAIGNVFSRLPDWGDRFRRGEVSFSDSKEFKLVFDELRFIFAHSWHDAFTVDQIECDERFARGEAAMYLTGSWSLQAMSERDPGIEIGIFPYPNKSGDAKLIFEPNMTFMQSSKTTHPEEVEAVLRVILESTELAAGISDFTKTRSLVADTRPEALLRIQGDIDRYMGSGQGVDASIGNTQLIWSFQTEIAGRLGAWLQKKSTLESVLRYADDNRSLSAP